MNKIITAKALTRDNFSEYGDVIEVNDRVEHFSINDGFTERYHDLADIDIEQKSGKILMNIFRSKPVAQPIVIEKMERHPLSSQSFIPMGDQPYLVVVAKPGEFNEDAIEIFLASADQGINYRAGTWHHFSLALNAESDFLVIDRGDRSTPKETNCDEVTLTNHIQIKLETV